MLEWVRGEVFFSLKFYEGHHPLVLTPLIEQILGSNNLVQLTIWYKTGCSHLVIGIVGRFARIGSRAEHSAG